MKRKQKLVAVHVTTAPQPGAPPIVPVTGEPLAELLESWRIVQIQPLGSPGTSPAEAGRYAALLLLEEAMPGGDEARRPGFGAD